MFEERSRERRRGRRKEGVRSERKTAVKEEFFTRRWLFPSMQEAREDFWEGEVTRITV